VPASVAAFVMQRPTRPAPPGLTTLPEFTREQEAGALAWSCRRLDSSRRRVP
jgi:hypothetical protein